MKPKNTDIENRIAAGGMVGMIGASLGFNILGVLYQKYGFLKGAENYKFTGFIFAIFIMFITYFTIKGKTYLKEIENEPEYKPRFKTVAYYLIFCILTCGLWTFFL